MTNLTKTKQEVRLAMDDKQFQDFIQSLLWKPQVISKDFWWYYCIEKDDIINLDKILSQRISQQNKGKRVYFRASIYYEDNSVAEVSSIPHLIDYNETLPLVCDAVYLTWKFLVKFEDKDSPEVQEVSISFISNDEPKKYDFEENNINWFFYRRSDVSLRIKHTARTWGVDIEGLISRHMDWIVKPQKKFLIFIRGRSYHEGTHPSILFIMLFSSWYILFNALWSDEGVQNGIKWIIFLITMYFLLSTLNYIWVNFFNWSLSKLSYILLNKTSIENKMKKEKKIKNNWIKKIIYLILQLSIAIVWNILFRDYF